MTDDRRVHAVTADGTELVRYDRAGKWYAEGLFDRSQVPFSEVVDRAIHAPDVRFGLPGGGAFDRRVHPYWRPR